MKRIKWANVVAVVGLIGAAAAVLAGVGLGWVVLAVGAAVVFAVFGLAG